VSSSYFNQRLGEYLLSTKDSCIELYAPIKWAKHSCNEVCTLTMNKNEIDESLSEKRVEFTNNSNVLTKESWN
jgi:hypothetical protein